MNLKNVSEYTIGLDIGTNSVGWAVIDENGDLCKFKGKNTWGVRLFESGETAAATRMHRTLRRRYARRRQRILDLREFMYPEIEKVDPDFFIRLDQSSLHGEDRNFSETFVLFNDEGFNEKDYYNRYKTIYHLRKDLVQTEEKRDIRLVYLALHHALKYRGHFLNEGVKLSAKDADGKEALLIFIDALNLHCIQQELTFDSEAVDIDLMNNLLTHSREKRALRQEQMFEALGMPASQKKLATALSKAMFGYDVDFSIIFGIEKSSDTSFSFGNEEKVEKFEIEVLPEDSMELFSALKAAYAAYMLGGILSGEKGETLSGFMVERYEEHRFELKTLKQLARKYLLLNSKDEDGEEKGRAVFNKLFKGPKYSDGTYNKKKASGYTGYILGSISREEFYAQIKTAFANTSFDEDDRELWNTILEKIEDGTFLRKLRTFENGAIPHQLHLEEVSAILEKQGRYYSCLIDNKEKIESLLQFRLPYYVGPLGQEKNPNRKERFGWSEKRPGMEGVSVKPWNFEEVVDVDAAAETFITRMTGECSYYLGKKAIPKHSLLYSEFCVRQELNGCRIALDGEKFTPFDIDVLEGIFNNVFKTRKKVKISDLREYLAAEEKMPNNTIRGTQKENEFASALTSYNDFRRILGREIESFEDRDMVEELILWITVYEDKKILVRKIKEKYGKSGSGVLNDKQIEEIKKLRYTGWSRLSKEFLLELKTEYQGRHLSIMDILRDSQSLKPMVLMEILSDERFGFQALLAEKNQAYLAENSAFVLEDIPGSPAIKRGINQSLKIIDEIVKIAGKTPRKICVEMAREEVGQGKGRRTRSREQQIKDIYSAMDRDLKVETGAADLEGKVAPFAEQMQDDRTLLYFLQGGKCIYCGKNLDINNLSGYHIDHIVPQSIIKDDSLDNRVLCCSNCNETKGNTYPIPASLSKFKIASMWDAQRRAGMMSEKKYRKLSETRPLDKQMKVFIKRQLVETRQITKHVMTIVQSLYPNTRVESIKAELTSDLRGQYSFCKSRVLNDYHHAHDAYLACQLSRFLEIRYPTIAVDLENGSFGRYSLAVKSAKKGKSGLFISSFGRNGFDAETGEIFRDAWNADGELGRIRECLKYKDCFVSRKVERLTGEFWNQTVYSAREKTSKAISLKKGLDPSKYGYYMSPNSAYYAAINCIEESRGKEKRVTKLVGIPINESYLIRTKGDLQGYLEREYKNPEILKFPIMKYQKICWEGAEYYLTSACEMINARQMCAPAEFVALLDERLSRKEWDTVEGLKEKTKGLFEWYLGQIRDYYPRYSGVYEKLSSEKTRALFEQMSDNERIEALTQLFALSHANASVGAKALGLPAELGRMKDINFGANLQEIEFIDTSATGLFERRSKIEL